MSSRTRLFRGNSSPIAYPVYYRFTRDRAPAATLTYSTTPSLPTRLGATTGSTRWGKSRLPSDKVPTATRGLPLGSQYE